MGLDPWNIRPWEKESKKTRRYLMGFIEKEGRWKAETAGEDDVEICREEGEISSSSRLLTVSQNKTEVDRYVLFLGWSVERPPAVGDVGAAAPVGISSPGAAPFAVVVRISPPVARYTVLEQCLVADEIESALQSSPIRFRIRGHLVFFVDAVADEGITLCGWIQGSFLTDESHKTGHFEGRLRRRRRRDRQEEEQRGKAKIHERKRVCFQFFDLPRWGRQDLVRVLFLLPSPRWGGRWEAKMRGLAKG